MGRDKSRNIEDPTAAERKLDHIKLAEASRIDGDKMDTRFYYEPMLAGHPSADLDIGKTFLGKRLTNPIWVSSMTGGTGDSSGLPGFGLMAGVSALAMAAVAVSRKSEE